MDANALPWLASLFGLGVTYAEQVDAAPSELLQTDA